ncbi:MAG: NAD(P)H-dependent oxidoreductase [Alcanivorax sp.]|nr:NAD(P)H-dependent oxidoreductase [Alcanivorax sp.]
MNIDFHIAVIIGSSRKGRLADSVAAWVCSQLDQHPGITYSLVDPLMFDLPATMADDSHADVVALTQQLAKADAFLVLVPEYNHSFPAALKHLIDYAYHEWQAKPVGFVSYGGQSGGIRAVEQLRLVFTELHAISTRDSLALPDIWDQFDNEGNLRNPERPKKTLNRVLAQLGWWAMACRLAQAETPYSAVT